MNYVQLPGPFLILYTTLMDKRSRNIYTHVDWSDQPRPVNQSIVLVNMDGLILGDQLFVYVSGASSKRIHIEFCI